jgi:hypothetical protein
MGQKRGGRYIASTSVLRHGTAFLSVSQQTSQGSQALALTPSQPKPIPPADKPIYVSPADRAKAEFDKLFVNLK